MVMSAFAKDVPINLILQNYKRCPLVTKDRIYALCPVSYIFNEMSANFIGPVLRSSSFGSFFETVLLDPIIQNNPFPPEVSSVGPNVMSSVTANQ